MADIIYRPMPVLNALMGGTQDAQFIRQQEEYERRMERERNKKLWTVAGGAALGAGVGLLATPALASAGLLATTGWGLPTAGAYGIAALGGAGLGASVGQSVANEDYAGAIGTVANTAGALYQRSMDVKEWGYSPSEQERAAFAKEAIKLGTSIGQLRKEAAASGVTIPQQLAKVQAARMDVEELDKLARDKNWNVTGSQLAQVPPEDRVNIFNALDFRQQSQAAAVQKQNAYDAASQQLFAAEEALVRQGLMERAVSPRASAEISALSESKIALERDLASGELTQEQATAAKMDIERRIQNLQQGTLTRKQQTIQMPDGKTYPTNQPFLFNDHLFTSELDPRTGALNYKHLGNFAETPPLTVPGPNGQPTLNPAVAQPLPNGQTIVRGANIENPPPDKSAEERAKEEAKKRENTARWVSEAAKNIAADFNNMGKEPTSDQIYRRAKAYQEAQERMMNEGSIADELKMLLKKNNGLPPSQWPDGPDKQRVIELLVKRGYINP